MFSFGKELRPQSRAWREREGNVRRRKYKD